MADTFAAVCNHLKQKGGKNYRQCEIIMIIMINMIIMIGIINITISSRKGDKDYRRCEMEGGGWRLRHSWQILRNISSWID